MVVLFKGTSGNSKSHIREIEYTGERVPVEGPLGPLASMVLCLSYLVEVGEVATMLGILMVSQYLHHHPHPVPLGNPILLARPALFLV